jgi:hypothetical protein
MEKKTIFYSVGGRESFFGYSVCRDGTEAMRIEEEQRTGRLSLFF